MDMTSARRRMILEAMLVVIAVATGLTLIWLISIGSSYSALQFCLGLAFTLSIVGFIWLLVDPDTHAARQSNELLQIASKTLDCTKEGLTANAAQQICELLLPATPVA